MPTAPTAIPTLPTPPSRTDPTNFRARADARLAAEPAHTNAMNALGANVYSNAVEAADRASSSFTSSLNASGYANQAGASAAAASSAQANAIAALANVSAAPGTTGTSASLVALNQLGDFLLVTQAGKSWTAGQLLLVQSRSIPNAAVLATVSSYSGTNLVITVTKVLGVPIGRAAAVSDWTINYITGLPAVPSVPGFVGKALVWNGSRLVYGSTDGVPVAARTTTNLMTWSEEIVNWNNEGVAIGGYVIAPNGYNTGRYIQSNGTLYGRVAISGSLSGVGPHTFSVYMKKLNVTAPAVGMTTYGGADAATDSAFNFDFDSKQFRVIARAGTTGDVVDGGFEDVGNGWFRVWATLKPKASHTAWVMCLYAENFGSASGPATYYWGAQVELGVGPGCYVTTAGATASGAGPRTRNLLPYSTPVDTNYGGWTKGTNMTRLANVVSPTGLCDATAYQTSSLGNAFVFAGPLVNYGGNTQYTVSVWARLVDGAVPTTGNLMFADFDSDGNPGTAERTVLPFVGSGLDSEWRRFSLTFTNFAAQSVPRTICFGNDWGNGAIIAYWGAQLETGPIATDFVPTGSGYADGGHASVKLFRANHVDTSQGSSGLVLSVPADMRPGDWFDVVDVGQAANVRNIFILRGAYPLVDGDATDFALDLPKWGGRFTMTYEKGLVVS